MKIWMVEFEILLPAEVAMNRGYQYGNLQGPTPLMSIVDSSTRMKKTGSGGSFHSREMSCIVAYHCISLCMPTLGSWHRRQ
eukprot:scaffold30042_cov78-Skeletonema_dohrnii-CCMP3373.AAC.1